MRSQGTDTDELDPTHIKDRKTTNKDEEKHRDIQYIETDQD